MNFTSKSQLLNIRNINAKKVIISFIGVSIAATLGSAGVAAAESNSNDPSTPHVVAICKSEYKALGFKNVGQCVSHLNGHGHGYGYGGGNDNDQGNEDNNDQGHGNHHFHFHNFVADWWHHFEDNNNHQG